MYPYKKFTFDIGICRLLVEDFLTSLPRVYLVQVAISTKLIILKRFYNDFYVYSGGETWRIESLMLIDE